MVTIEKVQNYDMVHALQVPKRWSNYLSSNPAEAYSFSVKFVFEMNENEQKKEAGVGPLLTEWK